MNINEVPFFKYNNPEKNDIVRAIFNKSEKSDRFNEVAYGNLIDYNCKATINLLTKTGNKKKVNKVDLDKVLYVSILSINEYKNNELPDCHVSLKNIDDEDEIKLYFFQLDVAKRTLYSIYDNIFVSDNLEKICLRLETDEENINKVKNFYVKIRNDPEYEFLFDSFWDIHMKQFEDNYVDDILAYDPNDDENFIDKFKKYITSFYDNLILRDDSPEKLVNIKSTILDRLENDSSNMKKLVRKELGLVSLSSIDNVKSVLTDALNRINKVDSIEVKYTPKDIDNLASKQFLITATSDEKINLFIEDLQKSVNLLNKKLGKNMVYLNT